MPERNVARSTRVTLKGAPAPSACIERANQKDPIVEINARMKACSEKTSLRPMGAPFKGTLDEKGPAASTRVRLSSGHCYRALIAASSEVESLVVVVRDSTGAKVAETPGPILLAEQMICAMTDDEVEVLMSVGRGKGGVGVGWMVD